MIGVESLKENNQELLKAAGNLFFILNRWRQLGAASQVFVTKQTEKMKRTTKNVLTSDEEKINLSTTFDPIMTNNIEEDKKSTELTFRSPSSHI